MWFETCPSKDISGPTLSANMEGTAIVAVAVVGAVAAVAIAAVAVAEPQLRTGHLLHIAHMATKNTTIFPSKYMSNHVNTT